jgi:hypothetical protein
MTTTAEIPEFPMTRAAGCPFESARSPASGCGTAAPRGW